MTIVKKVVIFVAIAAVLSFTVRASMPRGIRNNNPVNIRFNTANDWDGQTGSDGSFSKFSSSVYGIRAGAKLLSNYMKSDNLTSVVQIIEKWAPSTENHTASYAAFVAKKMGIEQSARISTAQIPALLTAMIQFENGIQPYPQSKILEGCRMAGVVA